MVMVLSLNSSTCVSLGSPTLKCETWLPRLEVKMGIFVTKIIRSIPPCEKTNSSSEDDWNCTVCAQELGLISPNIAGVKVLSRTIQSNTYTPQKFDIQ